MLFKPEVETPDCDPCRCHTLNELDGALAGKPGAFNTARYLSLTDANSHSDGYPPFAAAFIDAWMLRTASLMDGTSEPAGCFVELVMM